MVFISGQRVFFKVCLNEDSTMVYIEIDGENLERIERLRAIQGKELEEFVNGLLKMSIRAMEEHLAERTIPPHLKEDTANDDQC